MSWSTFFPVIEYGFTFIKIQFYMSIQIIIIYEMSDANLKLTLNSI